MSKRIVVKSEKCLSCRNCVSSSISGDDELDIVCVFELNHTVEYEGDCAKYVVTTEVDLSDEMTNESPAPAYHEFDSDRAKADPNLSLTNDIMEETMNKYMFVGNVLVKMTNPRAGQKVMELPEGFVNAFNARVADEETELEKSIADLRAKTSALIMGAKEALEQAATRGEVSELSDVADFFSQEDNDEDEEELDDEDDEDDDEDEEELDDDEEPEDDDEDEDEEELDDEDEDEELD